MRVEAICRIDLGLGDGWGDITLAQFDALMRRRCERDAATGLILSRSLGAKSTLEDFLPEEYRHDMSAEAEAKSLLAWANNWNAKNGYTQSTDRQNRR